MFFFITFFAALGFGWYLTKKPDKRVPYESNYLEGDHEPIVEPKAWDAVQERIKQNMNLMEAVGHLGGRPHFLYGKVFCADCGSPFTRRTFTGYKGVKYKAWVCRDRQLGRKGNGCMMRIIKETDLLAEICLQLGLGAFRRGGVYCRGRAGSRERRWDGGRKSAPGGLK